MFSRHLINRYLKRPLTFEEIRDHLTSLGLPVENIQRKQVGWINVVVGKVLTKAKHPNADRLNLLTVTDGERDYAVVCGAHNMKEGDLVALARVGAQLPGGVKIKKTKIRDVSSEGMCCSAEELALSTEPSEGIIILDSQAVVGRPVDEFLIDDDVLFDVEVTTNRPDCMGLIGLARELHAKSGIEMSIPVVENREPDGKVSIDIEDPKNCPRYAGAIIRGVTVQPSPDWLQQALSKCGLRSINSVVDVTNYVLIETSHPIHAFDLAHLDGSRIVVRPARPKETLQTLDENVRLELTNHDLMICDANKPVALAGIMGGEESGINLSTKDILIEVAMFDPVSVRKSGQRHKIKSEAGARFERGCDETAIPWVMNRVIDLIIKTCGGNLDGYTDSYPNPAAAREIRFDVSECRQLIGAEFEKSECSGILGRLGFHVTDDLGDNLTVSVPGHRAFDVTGTADLVEEIARVAGYDRIPYAPLGAQLRWNSTEKSEKRIDDYPVIRKERRIREAMAGFGFSEAINYTFISSALLDQMTANAYSTRIMLRDPLASDQDILRPTLYPGLLANVRDNMNRGAREVRLFELGTIFGETKAGAPNAEKAPVQEQQRLAAVVSRGDMKLLWKDEQRDLSVFDLRGVLDSLFGLFRIDGVSYRNIEGVAASFYHPGIVSGIYYKNQAIGHVGAIHPWILQVLDLKSDIFAFDLDLAFILMRMVRPKFSGYSVYQSVTQDISFIVDESVTNQMIYDVIKGEKIELIKSCYCFDIFHGSKLPEQKKSLAYSITYQHPERTLTQEEVNEVQERVIKALEKKLNIQMRA